MKNKRPLLKIPPGVLSETRLMLDEVVKRLEPYIVVLTPSERLSFRYTGSGLIKFLEISHALAVESPDMFPAFMKAEVFREEFLAASELWIIISKLDQLRNNVNDTGMLLGNRTLDIAIAFYETVKMAARRDIPGARVVFNDLKSAFPQARWGRGKKKEENRDRQLELFSE